MIYFIVTTSLYKNCDIRRLQYTKGINKLKQAILEADIENYEIIVVENNGIRKTFLDALGCRTLYTNNNFLRTSNKGYKELLDVWTCINQFDIQDTDFIVKMTGRYILEDSSDFMKEIKNIEKTKYNCVLRYGSFQHPVDFKTTDCITGIIGMTCKYVKKIPKPRRHVPVEKMWAMVTYLMREEHICKLNRLGINICPGSNEYFLV